MQVFVLSYSLAYEEGDVLGVFSTAEKAKESPEAEKSLPKADRQEWKPFMDNSAGVFCDSSEKTSSGRSLTTLIVTPHEVQ
jgi:hypothetical protein